MTLDHSQHAFVGHLHDHMDQLAGACDELAAGAWQHLASSQQLGCQALAVNHWHTCNHEMAAGSGKSLPVVRPTYAARALFQKELRHVQTGAVSHGMCRLELFDLAWHVTTHGFTLHVQAGAASHTGCAG